MSEATAAAGLSSMASGAIQDKTALNVISKTLHKVDEAEAAGAAVRQSVRQEQGVGTRLDVTA